MAVFVWARRLWGRIAEPRHLKVFYLCVYAVTVAVGVVTIVYPPASIEGQIGALLGRLWGSMFLVGGLTSAVTVLPGWWWAERIGVTLAIGALFVYAGIIIYLQAIAPPGSSRWTQLGITAIALSPFVLRLVLTRKWDYEPRRE